MPDITKVMPIIKLQGDLKVHLMKAYPEEHATIISQHAVDVFCRSECIKPELKQAYDELGQDPSELSFEL